MQWFLVGLQALEAFMVGLLLYYLQVHPSDHPPVDIYPMNWKTPQTSPQSSLLLGLKNPALFA
jgi:hypothetical protein